MVDRRARLHIRPQWIKVIHHLIFAAILNLPVGVYAIDDNHIKGFYYIKAGQLGQALSDFALQSGIALSFDPALTENLTTQGLNGQYSIRQGFEKLLQATNLHLIERDKGNWSIEPSEDHHLAARDMGQLKVIDIQAKKQQQATHLHHLTTNKQTIDAAEPIAFQHNMDLVRSPDDVQPYTIISREKIENTGASSIEELIQKILPMNTSLANIDGSGFFGNASQFNLRSLGTTHTLVLINGRRGAGIGYRGTSESTNQQNINNIPLAAIERIEILPASASAIYGSGALGGVINVVLRHDYVGTALNLRYDNTFDSDTAIKTVNVVTGFALENGQTHVLVAAQKSQANELTAADRNFNNQYRKQLLNHYPDAIYGMNADGTAIAPPYGNLVNIRTQDGSALLPQYSDASFAYLPKGYAGYAIDGFAPLQSTLGQYSLGSADAVSGFSSASSLVSANQTDSVYLSIYREFTERLSGFIESSYDRSVLQVATARYDRLNVVTLDANAASNPFGKTVLIAFPVSWNDATQRYRYINNDNKKAVIGLSYNATDDWLISADYSWSTAHIDMAHPRLLNQAYSQDYMSGLLDLLRDTTTYQTAIQDYWRSASTYTDQTMHDFSLRSLATVGNWYAGKIRLATGVEYRRIQGGGIPEYLQRPIVEIRKQNTSSLYAELSVPLISDEMDWKYAKLLELQIAGRHERFELKTADAKFSETSPTFGFRFAPNDTVMFRASYGEGFISPTVAQLGSTSLSDVGTAVIDPQTGKHTDVLTYTGGNPQLKPEIAKSINVGIVWKPDFIPNLRWSIDYYKIKKNNGITSLTAQEILDHANSFGDRIVRDDNGNLLTVNTMPFNALSLKTSGFDMSLLYTVDHIFAGLDAMASYTHVKSYKQQMSFAQEPVEYVNIPNTGPLKDSMSAALILHLSDLLDLGWEMQYYGKYKLSPSNLTAIKAQGHNTVASQTYHDVFARYKLPEGLGAKYGSPQLTVGIKNLLNDYEVDMSNTYISQYTDPRLRQYYLNLKFSF
ncbi:TonB-dependent receptor [Acinetobacter populi]|uniref:Secretin/TonB short N-terminal domain-containing protein n=1 Tax=Acinetobacter populi TaxID=1582270 RepID=A0A1Z9YYF7_9GAMM|nr:TonB-dependent receptor [Acinetobacter populi]OUY07202.1 hypothetical protein CAP51_11015 [Acinetobacter populi]